MWDARSRTSFNFDGTGIGIGGRTSRFLALSLANNVAEFADASTILAPTDIFVFNIAFMVLGATKDQRICKNLFTKHVMV